MEKEEKVLRERRSGVDRRRDSGRKLHWRYLLKGSRRGVRRSDDPREVYVDLFGIGDFAVVLIVLFLSILDAVFTLYHLRHGAKELNFLMAYTLNIGVGYFFVIKYSITAVGVIILCIHKNFRFIREVFIGIITIYSLLIVYHIALFFV
jgi:hypothetical protein